MFYVVDVGRYHRCRSCFASSCFLSVSLVPVLFVFAGMLFSSRVAFAHLGVNLGVVQTMETLVYNKGGLQDYLIR